jgi:hypothetical protein
MGADQVGARDSKSCVTQPSNEHSIRQEPGPNYSPVVVEAEAGRDVSL